MKVINQDENILSVGWAFHQIQPGKLSMSLTIKGSYKLNPNMVATAFPDEACTVSGDVHLEENSSNSIKYSSDLVPYKPRADLLLHATAHSPNGVPSAEIKVGFGVGDRLKQLAIVGDRQWLRGATGWYNSDPLPFSEMQLCYERALGGVDDGNNPVGKGRSSADLPNIEFLDHRVTSPDSPLPPAGFGPLHCEWDQRKSLAGTYELDYAEAMWPLFPKDFDSAYFNSAPRDQQVEGYLHGDEALVFYNLHPEHAEYHSALPGLRARCFVEMEPEAGAQEGLRELKLNLDTLWVDMHSERLMLIWRGPAMLVESPKLKMFRSIFVLTEPLDEPEFGIDHYHEKMKALVAAEDAEFDIDERVSDIDSELDAMTSQMDAEIAESELEMQHLEAETEAVEKKHLSLVREQLGADEDLLDKALALDPAIGLPENKAAGQLTELRAEDPKLAAEFEALQFESRNADAEMAAMDAEVEELEAEFIERSPLTRAAVIVAARDKKELKEINLSNLDLSKLDLQGLRAIDCRFHNTDFTDSNLSKTVLVESSFKGSIFTGANLTHATLDEARFSGAECTKTIFRESSLNGSDFSGVNLSGNDFSNAVGDYANFAGAQLTAAKFVGARLPRGDFEDCNLEGADFSGSDLGDADFSGVHAKYVNFSDANLDGLRTGGCSDFSAANFQRVSATGSNWEECVLAKSDFLQANFDWAQFGDADMRQCNFDRVSAISASFEGADLRGGWFGNANLMRCSFERTRLGESKVVGSNLYESGFLNATIDKKTDFTGSFLGGTLLELRKLTIEESKGGLGD